MAEAGHDNDVDTRDEGENEREDEETPLLLPSVPQREYEKEGARPKRHGREHEWIEDDNEYDGDKSVLYPPGREGVVIYKSANEGKIIELREKSIKEAWVKIREKYVCKPGKPPFVAIMKDGKIDVALLKGKDDLDPKLYRLFKRDGGLRKGLPPTIVNYLGEKIENIALKTFTKIQTNQEEISKLGEENTALLEEANDDTTTSDRREEITSRLNENTRMRNELVRVNKELTRENEVIEERLSLRDRVKLIFKKYGLTVIGVLTAIGVVIGSILSNLKTGLAKVAKGVGNGFKDLGAKLAGILPGMVGAIAKFLFDTAGEVVGFLAEHAWVLIVGLVVLVIESLKKKYGRKK